MSILLEGLQVAGERFLARGTSPAEQAYDIQYIRHLPGASEVGPVRHDGLGQRHLRLAVVGGEGAHRGGERRAEHVGQLLAVRRTQFLEANRENRLQLVSTRPQPRDRGKKRESRVSDRAAEARGGRAGL